MAIMWEEMFQSFIEMDLGKKGYFAQKNPFFFSWEAHITSGFVIQIWSRDTRFQRKDNLFCQQCKLDSSMEILLSANCQNPLYMQIFNLEIKDSTEFMDTLNCQRNWEEFLGTNPSRLVGHCGGRH